VMKALHFSDAVHRIHYLTSESHELSTVHPCIQTMLLVSFSTKGERGSYLGRVELLLSLVPTEDLLLRHPFRSEHIRRHPLWSPSVPLPQKSDFTVSEGSEENFLELPRGHTEFGLTPKAYINESLIPTFLNEFGDFLQWYIEKYQRKLSTENVECKTGR